MKKTILTFSVLYIFIFSVKGQNFLGEDFKTYKECLLKINPETPINRFTGVFYNDLKYLQSNFDENVIYPDSVYKYITVKDSLLNRVFAVEKIVDKAGDEFNSSLAYSKPIFILKDTLTKQIIYFKYDYQNESNFPFLISEIKLDEKVLCSQIEKNIDEFSGEIKINSPMSHSYKISSTYIEKDISKTNTQYYLRLRTHGSTAVTNGTGVTILFTDGTKLIKTTVKIDINATSDGFDYSAFITLTPTDLTQLKTKKIKKFRLNVFEENVKSIEAERFKLYMNCIINTK